MDARLVIRVGAFASALIAFSLPPSVFAQEKKPAGAKVQPALPVTADKQPLSRLAQQLFDAGHKTCASDLDLAVKFVHEDDGRYAMHGVWDKTSPDRRTALSVSSVPYEDGGGMVTTFTSTLDASGKCSITATQAMFLSKTCSGVRETVLKDWKFKGELASSTVYQEEGGGNLSIYLTPASSGCLLVKRYVAHF
jgi:hypothetical protein